MVLNNIPSLRSLTTLECAWHPKRVTSNNVNFIVIQDSTCNCERTRACILQKNYVQYYQKKDTKYWCIYMLTRLMKPVLNLFHKVMKHMYTNMWILMTCNKRTLKLFLSLSNFSHFEICVKIINRCFRNNFLRKKSSFWINCN